MMDGEVYADFSLLWLLCHESRVPVENPADCWLERWSKAAQEQGTRALDQLRDGVEAAITALGRGFLAHPANAALREALRTGDLTGRTTTASSSGSSTACCSCSSPRTAACCSTRAPRGGPAAVHRLLLDRPPAAAGRAAAGDAARRPVRRPEPRHGEARGRRRVPRAGPAGPGQLPLVAGGGGRPRRLPGRQPRPARRRPGAGVHGRGLGAAAGRLQEPRVQRRFEQPGDQSTTAC